MIEKISVKEILPTAKKKIRKSIHTIGKRQHFNLEQEFQKEIIDYIESIGGKCVKTVRSTRNGVSDLLVCLDGRFIAIEVKLTAKVDPLQEEFIEEIIKAGGKAFVLRFDKNWLNKLKKEIGE